MPQHVPLAERVALGYAVRYDSGMYGSRDGEPVAGGYAVVMLLSYVLYS